MYEGAVHSLVWLAAVRAGVQVGMLTKGTEGNVGNAAAAPGNGTDKLAAGASGKLVGADSG